MLLDSVFVFAVWTLIIWTDALVLTLASRDPGSLCYS